MKSTDFRSALICGLTILALAIPCHAAKSSEEADLALARQYAANLQREKCGQLVKKWIKKTRHKDLWLETDAMSCYYDGRADAGTAIEACQANPKNLRALATLAISLAALKKYKPGLGIANQALARDEKNGRARAAAAFCLWSLNKKEEARKAFERAVKDSPEDLDVNSLALPFFAKNGQPDLYQDACNRLVKYNPGSSYAYLTRAINSRRQFRGASALADFQRAVELNPENVTAISYYAKLLRERRNYAGAAKQLENFFALVKHPNDSFSANHFRLGDCYRHMKQYDRAIEETTTALRLLMPDGDKTFQRSWRRLPENPRIDYRNYWLRRVELYDLAGQLDRALENVNQMLACEPRDSSALYSRYLLYKKKKKYAEAINDLNTLIANNRDVSKYFALRAELFDEVGKSAQAAKDREKAAHIQLYGTPE